MLYGAIASLKRKLANKTKKDFGIPIISVGNLIAGGSGKTPFIIAIAKFLSTFDYGHIVVISRGYKRKSKGLMWISKQGKILANVAQSGDEPYLIATQLLEQKVSVIVSKNRSKAIKEALKSKARIVLLDDGFRFGFAKLDIILRPKVEPFFKRFLPSGLYRESPALYETLANTALILKEGKDFVRNVHITNPTPKMLLLTAIANPSRLDAFLPPTLTESTLTESSLTKSTPQHTQNQTTPNHCLIGKIAFSDHHHFTRLELLDLLARYKPSSILTTQKDAVKLQNFGLELSIMELELDIAPHILERLRHFVATTLQINNFKVIYHCGGRIFGGLLGGLANYDKKTNATKSLELFIQAIGKENTLQILSFLEYGIMASITPHRARFDISKQTKSNASLKTDSFGNRATSVPISMLWLPVAESNPTYHKQATSLENNDYDTQMSAYYVREAYAMLKMLFVNGMIDFWLEDTSLSSLGESFGDKERLWKYFYEQFLLAHIHQNPKQIAQSEEYGLDSPPTAQDSNVLTWDTPQMWNLCNLHIGHTKKGAQYFSSELAPKFFERYKDIIIQEYS